ncbi:MAG: ComEC/Rec2 family competence protein [Microbacterium sp.]|uniref:ComEC/Rec2 family competence protein n=1 Tax=Microbacterium sp. TaxID=51671 RepID=UPI0039E65DF4
MTRAGWRLAPAAAAAWGSAAWCLLSPDASWRIAGGSLLLATVLGVLLVRTERRRLVFALLVAAIAAACAATVVALAAPGRAAVADTPLSGGRALSAEVVVTGKVDPTATGARADAQLAALRIGDTDRAAGVPVTLLFDHVPEGIDMGSLLALTGTAFVADPGERAVLVVRVASIETSTPPAGVLAVVAWLRERFVAAATELPGAGAELIPGLAVGDTRAVGADLDQAMRTASLTHLVAVSGANCALVVGAGYLLGSALALRRGIRVLLGTVFLTGFVVLVTPEPSVMRAAAMAVVAMIALLIGRAGAGLAVLSLAVAMLLVLDPWLAFELGFALSVAATAALLVLAPPMARAMGRWMPRPVALALAVPLAAQLACGPLIVLVSPQLATYGVLANLVAAPAAPAATVLGLLACLAVAAPWLQAALTWAAWVPASWIATTAQVAAGLPAALLPWWDGIPGVAALAAAGAVVVLAIVLPRRRGTRLMRLGIRGLVVLLAGAAVGAGALATVAAPLTVASRWSVAACDVGQGDALVVRSAGHVMTIDTGPDDDAYAECLNRLGVVRIDVAVLTHFDSDHVGAAAVLAGRVEMLLHGPMEAGDDRVLASVGAAGVVEAAAGMTGVLGDAVWRVVWPRADDVFAPGNDSSVVVEIEGGSVPRTILLGDLGAASQAALRTSGMLRPPYQVVKVAHHGSADQDPGLYAVLGATAGVISVGVDNDYGHPRAETLELLARLGVALARTDQDGLVLLDATDGLTWWRERSRVGTAR